MFLSRLLFPTFVLVLFSGCVSAPPPPPLSPHEQLTVDTMRAKGLRGQFEKQVQFEKLPSVEKYLSALAKQITKPEDSLSAEKVLVRVHQDSRPELKRSFSFPGVMISIPKTFLYNIGFENELAAMISLELAQIEKRELARELDKVDSPPLFGENGIFRFSSEEKSGCIELGIKLMYAAGYDPRGMVTIFQKYSNYLVDSSTSEGKKELANYIKLAQKAKNDFMPSLQPIVRSNDFLRMKKDLKGSS